MPETPDPSNPEPVATPPAPHPLAELSPEQQAAVDQIVQGRVAQATRSGANTREQEIAAYLAAQATEAERADLAEVERLRLENVEATARAAEAEARATRVQRTADATTALVAAGLNTAHLSDALRLINTEADDLDAEVTALQARMGALFTPANETPPVPPTGITPPRLPGSTGGGKTAAERAKERFKPRFSPPSAA